MSVPERSAAEREERKKQQLQRERDSQIRGLLYLAGAVIVFIILRFGLRRVFTPYWWIP